MIDLKGYEKARSRMPGEFRKLPAGGYLCHVVESSITKSRAGNLMLVLCLDIAESDFAGYFKDTTARARSYGRDIAWDPNGIYRRLIFDNNGDCSDYFKGLLDTFSQSNPSWKFDPHKFDEKKLRGLNIGMIFAEEEYEKRDGTVTTKVTPSLHKTVDDIINKNFKVPNVKTLKDKYPSYVGMPKADPDADDEDLPF